MRVSNLIHERAYRSLVELQEIEPETYDRLEGRLQGVHAAAMYGAEKMIYSTESLPAAFGSWQEYAGHLLATMPPQLRQAFQKNWGDPSDDFICKHMVRAILLNDWEGEFKAPEPKKQPTWLSEL